jgi:hypothetical protein
LHLQKCVGTRAKKSAWGKSGASARKPICKSRCQNLTRAYMCLGGGGIGINAKLFCQTVGVDFFLFCQNFIDTKLFCQIVGAALSDLQMLTYLSLSHNMFQDSIPDSLSKLTSLVTLDLSDTSLSGTIPNSLARLTYLRD